ncbi:MAG: pimeloyl-ACP methyl ester carboxylesterase [Halioglobus sp.]|jgi:pimeloyl-ACP methyl ester carboxylesterase
MIAVFLLGPRVTFKDIDPTPIIFDIPLDGLDGYINDKESEVSDLKLGNQAKIVWADTTKSKTEYSVVYLHGFSASHEEGAPLHTDFAKRYGANLYLPRLYDHGRNTDDAFKGLLPEDLINSAKEAIAIGKLLGDKVILMTCSTGGTLAAILSPYDEAIHGMYMYSPNIDVYDTNSNIITGPWGRQLLTMVMGGDYNRVSYNDTAKKYWSEVYHIDGLIALKSLIKKEMLKKNFAKIDIPVYLGYYYKDEENQDKVVSVERMLDFYDQISTPEEIKRLEVFPEAGRHVMTSHVFSNDIDNVINKSYKFAEEILGLKVKS